MRPEQPASGYGQSFNAKLSAIDLTSSAAMWASVAGLPSAISGQLRDRLDRLDRLCLREHAFLDEHMKEALAQHQCHSALRIAGCHRFRVLINRQLFHA
jgi:hypothetical protein